MKQGLSKLQFKQLIGEHLQSSNTQQTHATSHKPEQGVQQALNPLQQ